MKLFHTTGHGSSIRAEGFRDGPSGLPTPRGRRYGVWFADRPMTLSDFASLGDDPLDVLAVELPDDVARPFEQHDDELGTPPDMQPYRAFLIPAEIVNRYELVD